MILNIIIMPLYLLVLSLMLGLVYGHSAKVPHLTEPLYDALRKPTHLKPSQRKGQVHYVLRPLVSSLHENHAALGAHGRGVPGHLRC